MTDFRNTDTNYFPINALGNNSDWITDNKLSIPASVEYEQGTAFYRVGDGSAALTTNATANFYGILAQGVRATDDDYATAGKTKTFYIPKTANARAEFTVGAGTFTIADVGKSVKFNDEVGLAVDTAGIQAVIVEYISPTRGICTFNQDIT